MASDVVSITSNYVTSAQDLLNATWAVGDSVYISVAGLKATNKVGDAFTNGAFGTNGVVGTVQEAPDITVSGDRMVLRLSASAAQNTRLKTLLQATEL